MFEHLFHNACGERDALLAGLTALPVIGVALCTLVLRWRTWRKP